VSTTDPHTATARGATPLIVAGWLLMATFVIIGGPLLENIYAGALTVAGRSIPHIRIWQLAYFIGHVGFALLLIGLHRQRGGYLSILVGAVLLRLVLLWAVPNNDCNRYLWEGRIQSAGLSPYRVAPLDPAAEPFRDAIWQGINHPDYTTIYPPLAQLAFRAYAAIWYDVRMAQIAHTLLDLAIVFVLAWIIRRRGGQPWQLALYALSPLVLASFAHAGHNDSLMLLPLVLVVAFVEVRRWPAAGLTLGLGALAKAIPLVLLAPLIRSSCMPATLAVAVVVVGLLPNLYANSGVTASLNRFPNAYAFNSFPDSLLELATGEIPDTLVGRNIVAILLLAAAAAYRLLRPRTFVLDARWLLALFILLLPIVHFWYLAWPLALISIQPRGYMAWLVLGATMGFYWEAEYSQQQFAGFSLAHRSVILIWVPFYLAWIVEWAHNRKHRQTHELAKTE